MAEVACKPRGGLSWSCPTLDDVSSIWSVSVFDGLRAIRVEASPGDSLAVELPALRSELCLARPTPEASECFAAIRIGDEVLYLGEVRWDEHLAVPLDAGAAGAVTVACSTTAFLADVSLDELDGGQACAEVEGVSSGRVCASPSCHLRSEDPVLGLMWAHRPRWADGCTRELPPGDYVLSCPDREVIAGTQMWSVTEVALAPGEVFRYTGP